MDRRTLLGALATSGSVVAGCLDTVRTNSADSGVNSSAETRETPVDDGTDESPSIPEPSGECGIATEPLSSRLVDDGGDARACTEDMHPSLELANERDDAISATVAIESDGDPVYEGTYDLESGERALENRTVTVDEFEDVRIAIDGESGELTGSFDEFTCRRHAIALTNGGVEIGYVPPMAGPADTEHDCYAGDSSSIDIYNGDTPRTVTVSIVDHCEKTTEEQTFELAAGDFEHLTDVLTSGGRFDVIVDVDDGGADHYEFHEECWGLSSSISDDGTPEIGPIGID